jgi:hypothetical protein
LLLNRSLILSNGIGRDQRRQILKLKAIKV